MTPTIDLMKVLTAVTPIVTSIASMNNNKNTEVKEVDKAEPKINITINNHFYTNPSVRELQAVEEANKKIIDEISENKNRYFL